MQHTVLVLINDLHNVQFIIFLPGTLAVNCVLLCWVMRYTIERGSENNLLLNHDITACYWLL